MLGSLSNSYVRRAATVARRLFPGSKNSWFVSVVGGIVRSGSNVAGGCCNLIYSMSEVSVHLRLGRSNGSIPAIKPSGICSGASPTSQFHRPYSVPLRRRDLPHVCFTFSDAECGIRAVVVFSTTPNSSLNSKDPTWDGSKRQT